MAFFQLSQQPSQGLRNAIHKDTHSSLATQTQSAPINAGNTELTPLGMKCLSGVDMSFLVEVHLSTLAVIQTKITYHIRDASG